jgi:hypothetical protein
MQDLKEFKLRSKESFIIHVADEKQGIVLLRILDSMGFRWNGGGSLLEETHYEYKSNIAYEIQEKEGSIVVYYSSLSFYEDAYEINYTKYTHASESPVRLEAYKIYSFEDAILRNAIYQVI